MLKTKQFFVQFLTSVKILIMFITQTTKSMKINALQILIKPPYLINFLLQWLLMMQQVLSIATSQLEAFQRDDFKHIEWDSLEVWYLETSFCFFRVETFFSCNIWYRQYNELTHLWTYFYFDLNCIPVSIFSLVISEGPKSSDEAEFLINSSAELKKCYGHLWGVS